MAFEKCETEIAADRFESTSNGYTIPYCGLIAFRGSYRLIRSITGTVTVLCALQMLPLPGVISGTAVAVRLKEWLKISDWPRRRIFTAKRTRRGLFQDMFARLTEDVDALALCGVLWITVCLPWRKFFCRNSARFLKKSIPTLAVFGNYEFESGKADQIHKILTSGGITVIDGGACEINGIGFAGIKGFSGGFGERVLEPWGETVIKRFVREAVDEALKLESALARLRTSQRIALLHYAPIAQTIAGKPPEVYAFLGCSRLEEPLDRYTVTAATRIAVLPKAAQKTEFLFLTWRWALWSLPQRITNRILELPVNPTPS